MTHETYIVQVYRKRRWVNANYYDSLDEAKVMARFYHEKTSGNLIARVKEKYSGKVIFESSALEKTKTTFKLPKHIAKLTGKETI